MGESRVMAVSIGFAAAGLAVMSLLAACAVTTNAVQEQVLDSPIRSNELASSAVEDDPAAEVAIADQRHDAETEIQPLPAPTPRETRLPPQPRAQPDAPRVEAEEAIDRSGRFDPLQTNGGIRSVDFRNGFTYPIAGLGPVTVTSGHAELDPQGNAINFEIDDVIYADATGDGVEDAAVVSHFTDEWGQLRATVRLFAIADGFLEDWGSSWIEYNSAGGIASVDVDRHLITIESWTQDRSALSTVAWETQGPAMGLARIQARPPRSWIDLRAGATAELSPQAGAVRAVVAADAAVGQSFVFDAEPAWMLRVEERTGGSVALRIRHATTGQLVADATALQPVQLGGGRYVAEVIASSTPGDVTFEIEVTDQRTMLAPDWETRSEVVIDQGAARREVRLTWPEFTTAAGAANLDAVNATIRSFVEERRQRHATAVESCSEDEGSILVLSYHLTLVSYDLVSINFNEFICLCESGDSFENQSLTIDMNTGQPVGNTSIINANAPAVRQLWFEQAVDQNYWIDADLLAAAQPELTTTSAIALHPDGVTVSGVFNFEDDAIDLSAKLTFEELDGLVDDAIATRARSGAAVALPVEEGCGC